MQLFPSWNIVLHIFSQFGQFFPVLDGKNWEKQVYPSLSHFGQEKQVLDGKIPTLAWMILQKPVLSIKCNDFFKMANLKAISSSATLTHWELRPRQNCCHFADDIFKCIFLNEMYELCLRLHWNLFLRFELTLPERTRGRPWGRLRVRIRSIEKTSSWKFYPAAQNFTNRMLFRNTYIFKTI